MSTAPKKPDGTKPAIKPAGGMLNDRRIRLLLAIIGVNMVRESFGGDEKLDDDYSAKAMLPLAVATSIDAFAVGVSFAAMQVNILPAAGLIGCITCLLSAIGVRVGALFGDKYRAPSERIGGIVLILIGLKTLLTGLGIL